MELGEYGFLATISIMGMSGAILGVYDGWRKKTVEQSAFYWTFGFVAGYGLLCLVLGGTLPIPGDGLRAYGVVSLAAVASSIGAYFGAKLGRSKMIQSMFQASVLAALLAFLVFYYLPMDS